MKKLLVSFVMVLMCVFALASCDKKDEGTVLDTLKLSVSHLNTTLAEDGIEDATLVNCVDGDTTNFTTKNSHKSVKVRYNCIDTPESTQGYDKWGKAASVYNASRLTGAEKVVLEYDSALGKADGNGRALCYVWYVPAGETAFKLLNLEMVEQGYSLSGATSSTKYYSYFKEAENKAKAKKRGLFGNDVDKYYSEEVTNVTLKDLKTNPDFYYDKTTSIPKCVAFDAVVISVSENNGFKTAVVEQVVDGQAYQYTVTVGYSSGGSLYSLAYTGMYLHVVGWTDGSGAVHGCKMATGQKEGIYSYAIKGSTFYALETCTATVEGGKLVIRGTHTNVLGVSKDIVATYSGSDVNDTLVAKYNGKAVTIFAYYEDATQPTNLTIYCKAAIKLN